MIKTPANFADFPADLSLGWVSSEAPNFTIINFIRVDKGAALIEEIYAFLRSASVLEIDIACEPHFPNLDAIVEEKLPETALPETAQGPRYSVRLVFDRGSVSFAYREVSFLVTEKKAIMMMGRR